MKFWIVLSRTVRLAPELNSMPMLFAALAPSISKPISVTLPETALIVMALPDAGPVIDAQPLPLW